MSIRSTAIAIIGGTGLEQLPSEFERSHVTVKTVFGEAIAARCQAPNDLDLIFLSRHGENHALAPHEINFRANIAALVQLGVERVFATNAVGSLRTDLAPGSLVLLDDFIDFTSSRPKSYWDSKLNSPSEVVHTDFSTPYCPELRSTLMETAGDLGVDLAANGTYVCCDGPRFESPAEIRMFAQWGGDVVGMTGLPEAVFAREAGLCYAAIAIVTNVGSGLTDSPVDHQDVLRAMSASSETGRSIVLEAARRVPAKRTCGCAGTNTVSPRLRGARASAPA